MRTALAVIVTLGLVTFLALPASAAPAPAPAPAPKAAAPAPVGPGALFVESEEGAATKLVISGSIRTCWDTTRNMDDFDSDNGRNYREYLDSRVELGFLFQLNEGVEVFLQPQVNYVWGNRQVNQANGDDNLRLYQAWVALHPEILGRDSVLKVGRQELVLGSEMLVGNNSRYSGLSFDAIRLDLKLADGLTTSLFGAKLLENDRGYVGGVSTDISTEDPGDAYLFGLWNTYTGLADTTIDVYGLLLQAERGQGNGTNTLDVYNEVNLWTIGARLAIKPMELAANHAFDLDFSIEGATQFGTTDDGTERDVTDAYALESELGVTLGSISWTPRLAIGTALASGDSDPANDKARTFSPLFQDTTERLGDADMVSLSNLKSWYLKGSLKPTEKLEVGATYFRFEAMHVEDTVGGGNLAGPTNGLPGIAGNDNDVGDELDFYADVKLTKNVSLRGVFAWVDPSDMVTDQPGYGNSPASRLFAVLAVKW